MDAFSTHWHWKDCVTNTPAPTATYFGDIYNVNL